MSKELKVGLLTIATLLILIVGFNFLKGKDLFEKSVKIYAVFPDLGDVTKSNLVKINGLQVGTVSETVPLDANVSGVRVAITLTREDVHIPVNSVAYITAPLAGLGSATIVIEPGNSTSNLKNGDTISTRVDQGLFGGLSSEVAPTLSKIRTSLDSLNRVFGNVNTLLSSDAKNNLQGTIANFQAASSSLNRLLSDNGALAGTMNNVNSITGNLKRNNDSISAILANTRKFTSQLSQLELKNTMDTLQAAVNTMKSTMTRISSPDGTLGALINDRGLYNKINDATLSAEILLDDLRAHPKRYVNLSIFGRKDRGGALTSPSIKDTVPQ